MKNKLLDNDKFIQGLELILNELYSQIKAAAFPTTEFEGIYDLDKYVMELNKFYYQSFHEKFFPQYHRLITDDINRLLSISHQEEHLQQDILAVLKRYTSLYNQIKRVISLLTETRYQCNQVLIRLGREENRYGLEILYSMKAILSLYFSFIKALQQIEAIVSNQDLILAVHKHPSHLSIPALLFSWNDESPIVFDAINRLLVSLQYTRKLIINLQKAKKQDTCLNLETIKEIKTSLVQDTGKNNLSPLKNVYSQLIPAELGLYIQLLETYVKAEQFEQLRKTAFECEKYLDNLLLVMEQSLECIYAGQGELLASVNNLSFISLDDIKLWSDTIQSIISPLEKIVEYLSKNPEPDPEFFLQSSRRLIAAATSKNRNLRQIKELKNVSYLTSLLYRIDLELSFADAQILLLQDKQAHNSYISAESLSLVNMLDSYLSLLGNIRADLERLLAPRNLSRIWKGYGIRVERIPLETGQLFPEKYLYLLDEYQIETKTAPGPGNTILYQEGDLFIIQLDDLITLEIPYLIVSREVG